METVRSNLVIHSPSIFKEIMHLISYYKPYYPVLRTGVGGEFILLNIYSRATAALIDYCEHEVTVPALKSKLNDYTLTNIEESELEKFYMEVICQSDDFHDRCEDVATEIIGAFNKLYRDVCHSRICFLTFDSECFAVSFVVE